MSLASVRSFLAENAPELQVIVSEGSTASVAEAAQQHGVEPGQIAKTLAFETSDGRRVFLVVARGDGRIDNAKMKTAFGGKTRMLDAERVLELTGHPVGGVCPFGLATPVPVYCDVSLRAYDMVIPAAGSTNSAVKLAPQRMAELTGADWVDVCRNG